MAAEAKRILFIVVRTIKTRWEFLLQQLCINGAVRVMAHRAATLFYGTVNVGHRFGDDVGMAAKTDLFLWLEQKLFVVAGMG